MTKLLKWIGFLSVLFFVGAQFVGPETANHRISAPDTIEARTQMPPEVSALIQRSCRDCHTEQTDWRWYSKVAPFSWLQTADVGMARDHVNFSRWSQYTRQQQDHMLKEMCEVVESGDMPLWYYKPLHPGSSLSAGDRTAWCEWTKAERRRLAQ